MFHVLFGANKVYKQKGFSLETGGTIFPGCIEYRSQISITWHYKTQLWWNLHPFDTNISGKLKKYPYNEENVIFLKFRAVENNSGLEVFFFFFFSGPAWKILGTL